MNQKERLKQVNKIAKPMIREGKTINEILGALSANGIKNKLGKEYNQDALYHLISYHKMGRPSGMRKPKVFRTKKPQPQNTVKVVANLIKHSNELIQNAVKLLEAV